MARVKKQVWIQKQNLPVHLKSPLHTESVDAQKVRAANQKAREQLQKDCEVQAMEFTALSSTITPSVPMTTLVSKPNREEEEMWNSFPCADEVFDAGIDPTIVAVEERRRLEREAVNFELWQVNNPTSEGANEDLLLLDELEQDEILMEALQNACTCAI